MSSLPSFRCYFPLFVFCLALVSAAGCDSVLSRFRTAPAPTPIVPIVGATLPSASPSGEDTPETLAPYEATHFEAMSPRAQSVRIPVIMYHDVLVARHGEERAVNATKKEFDDQIAWLEKRGASFITLEQLHRHLTRGEALPPHAVALTFDDNYQGFHDNAYPLLKAKHIPAAMFVHTNFVGDTTHGHPKMSWDTLRELDKEGLVTICSHTLSHPPDLTKLSDLDQEQELTEAKATLERELGHPIPFFAYPVGKEDQTTLEIATKAGYTMAFTMHNGPVEESPGILTLNRYNYTELEKAWDECEKVADNAPASVVDVTLANNPVTLHIATFAGAKLGFVRGGTPSTWRGETGGGRFSVGEFIQQANTKNVAAVAGMNGTFFTDASLRGTSNTLIGPCKTYLDPQFYPETSPYLLTKLRDRPLVIWGPNRFAIVPFNPDTMNDLETLKAFMPGFTDAFLAGAWIVHDGVARTKEQMAVYSARDFNDPRRRAFFGITKDGDVVLGGTLDVITTEQMAKAVAEAGVKEAVLMDSGFSTSIVFDHKVIVTGHTAKDLPSRPVPHSILVSGTLTPPTEPTTLAAFQQGEPSVGTISAAEAQAAAPAGASAAGSGGGGGGGSHRRHRRR